MRLLQYLRGKLGLSCSVRSLKQALENNACKINGRIEHFGSTLVGWGDTVYFSISPKTSTSSSKIKTPSLSILFQDADFLVVNKPAGIRSEDIPSLSALGHQTLALAHRLDKETSGVLILTKTERANSAIYDLFKSRKILKKYLAIVEGIPQQTEGLISNHLGKINSYQGQSIWGSVDKDKGVLAVTTWILLNKGRLYSLLECSPLTGRTHQIRVHLASIAHPILGDALYNKSLRTEHWPVRCLLHASKISFIHPFSKNEICIEAPTPADFTQTLKNL